MAGLTTLPQSRCNMAKTGKNNMVSITGLTLTQYSIIVDIVNTVKDIMAWDEDMQEYTDHDNFLYSMSEEEYQELQNIKL